MSCIPNNFERVNKVFFDNFIPEPMSGCWIWIKAGQYGYGYMILNKKKIRAHRLSWIIHNGDIPEGLLVCHKCDVKCCVNPNHLFLGTGDDNMQDMIKKNRCKFIGAPRKEKCKRGHTIVGSKRNERACQACKRITQRQRRKSINPTS
jgi:HNH endonuclease